MGTFLLGLAIGAVAGGAVVFVYKKKIEKYHSTTCHGTYR